MCPCLISTQPSPRPPDPAKCERNPRSFDDPNAFDCGRSMHAYARIACMGKNLVPETKPDSDAVRRHAYEKYVCAAHRRKQKTVSINVGEVHRALALNNRVP